MLTMRTPPKSIVILYCFCIWVSGEDLGCNLRCIGGLEGIRISYRVLEIANLGLLASNVFWFITPQIGANPEKWNLVNFRGPDWRNLANSVILRFSSGQPNKILPNWGLQNVWGEEDAPEKSPYRKILDPSKWTAGLLSCGETEQWHTRGWKSS